MTDRWIRNLTVAVAAVAVIAAIAVASPVIVNTPSTTGTTAAVSEPATPVGPEPADTAAVPEPATTTGTEPATTTTTTQPAPLGTFVPPETTLIAAPGLEILALGKQDVETDEENWRLFGVGKRNIERVQERLGWVWPHQAPDMGNPPQWSQKQLQDIANLSAWIPELIGFAERQIQGLYDRPVNWYKYGLLKEWEDNLDKAHGLAEGLPWGGGDWSWSLPRNGQTGMLPPAQPPPWETFS